VRSRQEKNKIACGWRVGWKLECPLVSAARSVAVMAKADVIFPSRVRLRHQLGSLGDAALRCFHNHHQPSTTPRASSLMGPLLISLPFAQPTSSSNHSPQNVSVVYRSVAPPSPGQPLRPTIKSIRRSQRKRRTSIHNRLRTTRKTTKTTAKGEDTGF